MFGNLTGHFQFGKYVDSVMQSRVAALANRLSDPQLAFGVDEDLVRSNVIFRDPICHRYVLLAIQHYATALKLDTKHVYQALPRLLSLWFDFTAIKKEIFHANSRQDTAISEYLGKNDSLVFNHWMTCDLQKY